MNESIEELIKRPYARVLTPDENGGYVSEVLELPGCFSEGDTPDEAMENLEDAMRGWFEFALEQGREIPTPLDSGEYNGKILLRVPKSVHRECVRHAAVEGVSLNQWLVEAISERLGADGFIQRLMSKLDRVPSLVVLEQQRTTTTEVSHMMVRAQREIQSTAQLMKPDGERYYYLDPLRIKETQDA
jgi:antitoxin HicB